MGVSFDGTELASQTFFECQSRDRRGKWRTVMTFCNLGRLAVRWLCEQDVVDDQQINPEYEVMHRVVSYNKKFRQAKVERDGVMPDQPTGNDG